MTAIEKLEQQNNIQEEEFDNVMSNVFQSILIRKDYKSEIYLGKKEELLNCFIQFLEKYLELQFINSKKDKLALINFIDKINMHKELLELQRNKIDISQMRIAGKRLGKKTQSAFISD